MELKTKDKFVYKPSRHLDDFHLAGFAYYDGLDVIDELKAGVPVNLVKEEGNPYDEKAVAIYYKNHKIGYIPAAHNSWISTMLFYGHADAFEARIQASNLDNHPERQFRVVVKVRDSRK